MVFSTSAIPPRCVLTPLPPSLPPSFQAIYTFVGLLALEQEAERTSAVNMVNLFIYSAGLGLVGLGTLYFMMGLLCLKGVRDRQAADYTICRSQAELEEALRRHADMGKEEVETIPSTYQAGGGGGYTSVVI